ncbi:MAG: flavodoxin [Fretibacterium sp.]|nr:flavodoxin [Fretibacterium sp.]
MKKYFLTLMMLLVFAGMAGAAEKSKALVAVFSRADENYGVGFIEKGNTMILAEMIAEQTGAELFEIRAAKPYPKNYDECTDVAKKEQTANARPALAEDKDISGYDTIFLGYPCWWGDMPMPVFTFLEAHDFSGKTVIPFCTHEGSGMGRTESSLKRTLRGAKILKGLAMRGATAQNSRDEAKESVASWLKGLGF